MAENAKKFKHLHLGIVGALGACVALAVFFTTMAVGPIEIWPDCAGSSATLWVENSTNTLWSGDESTPITWTMVGGYGGYTGTITGAMDVTGINNVIVGSSGSDNIFGRMGIDKICGSSGADLITGGPGNDIIRGGGDNDTILGDFPQTGVWPWFMAGSDHIVGGSGDDTLLGGPANDTIIGENGDDTIHGDFVQCFSVNCFPPFIAGIDTINGGTGNDNIAGGHRDDVIRGNEDDDVIFGGFGDDEIYGGIGEDGINGGVGNDLICGDGGNDDLFGDVGDDRIQGDGNVDTIDGGSGSNDICLGGEYESNCEDTSTEIPECVIVDATDPSILYRDRWKWCMADDFKSRTRVRFWQDCPEGYFER